MIVNNAQGHIWYGLHMVSGVAEYREPDTTYRIFVNDNTIRKMGPTFAGRPVYVMHVDDVPNDINEMRKEADGVVIESFFNEADGKHWVKFVSLSDKAERAIKNGMKLSNCYLPKAFSSGGMCNGVDYQKEITDGVYEHLAIVPNPRYQESVILSPDQFKKYNEDKKVELFRLANEQKGEKMKLKFWERKKVENAIDIENLCVTLPKSNKELTISQLVNEADDFEALKGKPRLANADDFVEIDGAKVNVSDLVEKFVNAKKEEDCMANDDEDDDEDDDSMENEEDDMKAKKEAEEKEMAEKKNKKKNAQNPHPNADKLRNSERKFVSERVENQKKPHLSMDGAKRGRQRYGS